MRATHSEPKTNFSTSGPISRKKFFFSPYSKVDLQPPIAIFTAAPCILHLVALEARQRPRRQQQAPSPPLQVQRTNLRLQLPPCNKHPPKLRLEPQRPLAEDLPTANGLFPKVLMFDSLMLCQWTELLKIQVSIKVQLWLKFYSKLSH